MDQKVTVTYREFYQLETTHGNRCVAVSGFDPSIRIEFDNTDARARQTAVSRIVQLNTQVMDFLGYRGIPIWKMQIGQIKGHYLDLQQEFQTRNNK